MDTQEAKLLLYDQFGSPERVLKVTTSQVGKPAEHEVTVKWLLAPINPSDVACMEGNWPIEPTLPACPGNDGVGEVVAVGSGVHDLKTGDRVLAAGFGLGTWRTLGNYQRNQVMPVSKELSLEAACIFKINPCTAYRMLKDFVTLKAGDTVIQNGGNSFVAQMVIQLCSLWNCTTVNVVRNRSNIEELKEELTNLGADEILTEEELQETNIFRDQVLPRPKLALDCVGGESTLRLLEQLDYGGILVSYGSIAKKDIVIPPTIIRYKNLTIRGFWLTDWTKKNASSKEMEQMYKDLTELFKSHKLVVPKLKRVAMEEYEKLFSSVLCKERKTTTKYVFDMTK